MNFPPQDVYISIVEKRYLIHLPTYKLHNASLVDRGQHNKL